LPSAFNEDIIPEDSVKFIDITGRGLEKPMDFDEYFAVVTQHTAPHEWQRDLARETKCRDRLIRIPTGLGKTEGVVSAWSFHRLERQDDSWPRRLVWCLPMRVLVEQTVEVARRLAERMPKDLRPSVNVAMGGEDSGEWFLFPERPAIIVGTQDMLLSRALNRGYACPRARWPIEFGLLSHDALWIMDEVQLMDVGLATSAQLQAFREEDSDKHLRPCRTWWMSATLQPRWLRSVDTALYHDSWTNDPCTVVPAQQKGGPWQIKKSIETAETPAKNHRDFAQRIIDEHSKLEDGEFGRITLVVCNTVDRACEAFRWLQKLGRREDLELVHSRFRPSEREKWRDRFLSRSACTSEVDRIIVATQVVEAGVDISAGCLITELAPWPSLVQRFGRCARYGGVGKVVVVDRGRNDKDSPPYDLNELEAAWEAIQQLEDVGIKSLETYEADQTEEARDRLYPYSPDHLLLRKEFDELFDTTPDLTGADLDISRFIRTGDERDLQVFWLDIPKDKKGEKHLPPKKYKPQRKVLCSVPFKRAREWLFEKAKLRAGKRAWIWDWLDGEWKRAAPEGLLPGRVVCVASDTGGYSIERGFDPKLSDYVPEVQQEALSPIVEAANESDDESDNEQLSFIIGWKSITFHTREVIDQVTSIAAELGLDDALRQILQLAAEFHDWGKAHPAFQNMLFRKRESVDQYRSTLMAKSQKVMPSIRPRYFADCNGNERDERCGFRHELASALALFTLLKAYAPTHPALLGPWKEAFEALGKTLPTVEGVPPNSPLIQRLLDCDAESFDLVAFLIASHHGKVRVGLHASPKDQEYRDLDQRGLPIRGIRERDKLPAAVLVDGEPPMPEVELTLSPAALGLSMQTGMSWRERCIGLLDRHGPAALAYLEAVLRAADVRASQSTANDPAFTTEANS
jgi:CRISPR-associated endonuclease/helicase Cas3